LLSLLVSFAIDSPSGRWLADKPLAAKGGQSSAPAGAENRCHEPNSAPRQPALVD
jgi:hypothetical protein